MPKLYRGIFTAIALSLTFGAVQLAAGRDLSGISQSSASALSTDMAVNRAAKANRAPLVAGYPVQMHTVSRRLDGSSDTSVLIRVPVANGVNNPPSGSSPARPNGRRIAVACEPVVSVLTEIAKQLQPGRCVT
jgi:hypothetical protein